MAIRRGIGRSRILVLSGMDYGSGEPTEEGGGILSYTDNVYKLEIDSDSVRIYPGAVVQLFMKDTATLKWEGTADADGAFTVVDLPTGQYDLKVDGNFVKTINHILATEARDAIITWFKSGTVSGDFDHDANNPAYVCPFKGTVESIEILVSRINASTDATFHLLKGTGHAAYLTIATESAWDYRVFPGEAGTYYYFKYDDASPAISFDAGDVLALGIDYTAGDLTGVQVQITLRPELGI